MNYLKEKKKKKTGSILGDQPYIETKGSTLKSGCGF